MRWLQLVPPAGAILLIAFAAVANPLPVLAIDNVVSIEPSGVEVAPGGSFKVKLIDDPTPASTAIWALDLVFDPAVVTTTNSDTDCDTINTPPGAIGAFDCQVIDADKDGTPETMKILGVVLFTGTQTGLIEVSTLANITFRAIGQPGACTDLKLRVRSHADKDGNETGALVQDGRACIEAAAPPSGTASPNPVTPRTSEPTEPPTPTGNTNDGTPSDEPQSGSPGQTAQTGGVTAPGGSTSLTSGSATPRPGGSGPENDDGGGTSPFVWVLAGGIVLALAAGLVWSLVRLRGASPPSDSPPS